MKVISKQKYNNVINDNFIEVSSKINNIVIKDNYYGFTERQAKKSFKADLKRKIKTNSRFRISLFNRKKVPPREITLGRIRDY